MKSKKLFAILTLVAFMMTLLPAAAFATATYTGGSSYISVDDTSVKTYVYQSPDDYSDVDGSKITIFFKDSDNQPITPAVADDFYIRTSNSTIKFITSEGTMLSAVTDSTPLTDDTGKNCQEFLADVVGNKLTLKAYSAVPEPLKLSSLMVTLTQLPIKASQSAPLQSPLKQVLQKSPALNSLLIRTPIPL